MTTTTMNKSFQLSVDIALSTSEIKQMVKLLEHLREKYDRNSANLRLKCNLNNLSTMIEGKIDNLQSLRIELSADIERKNQALRALRTERLLKIKQLAAAESKKILTNPTDDSLTTNLRADEPMDIDG